MKELIDNTHSRAYSPQSHSDRHINTHSCAQNGKILQPSERARTRWEIGGRQRVVGREWRPSNSSHHLVWQQLSFSARATASLAHGAYSAITLSS